MFFVEDRLAQLRWTREDLAAAGGPASATLRKAVQRGGGLTPRSLTRLDLALGWQDGSAERVLRGGSPAMRVSGMITACSGGIDAAIQEAERLGVGLVVRELIIFLRECAQGFEAFYTRLAGPIPEGVDVCRCG